MCGKVTFITYFTQSHGGIIGKKIEVNEGHTNILSEQ